MPIIRIFGLLLLTGLVGGCSTAPSKPNTPPSRAPELITQNLINVLFQINSVHPQAVTLLVPPAKSPKDPFADALNRSLQLAGYALRTTGGDASTVPVSYSVKRSVDASSGAVNTYTLNMGHVSVRRAYQPTDDGWATPVSSMQIRGADVSQVLVNDDMFLRAGRPTTEPGFNLQAPALPKRVEPPNAVVQAEAPQLVQPPTAVLPETFPSKPSGESSVQAEQSQQIAAIQSAPKQNLRHLGQSNFAEVLNPLSTVNEAILVFEDDSVQLGASNKERVHQFVSQYNPEQDVFSVTGCSHGPTAHIGGQKALAIGRANRVREALMFAGVPESKILDEACWASEQFDERMPRRGVVLSIKRRS